MNGSIRPTVVIRPFARPHSEPAITAKRTAAVSIRAGSAMTPEFMNRIIRLATKATIAPTDRSRSPEEMTKVAPIAMMAMKALRVATLARLFRPMKFGLTIAPRIRSSTKAAKGATARRSISRQFRRRTSRVSSFTLVSTPTSRPIIPGVCFFSALPAIARFRLPSFSSVRPHSA